MEEHPFQGEAEAAYNAYCASRNWKSVRGDDLPQFDQQSPELQEAWKKAAEAAVRHYMDQ